MGGLFVCIRRFRWRCCIMMCESKAGAKSSKPSLFNFAQNLYVRPEYMHDKLLCKILKIYRHFGQKSRCFLKVLAFICPTQDVGSLWEAFERKGMILTPFLSNAENVGRF